MKKVIFLDIDGVLQPGYSQKRFNYNLDELKTELAKRYNEPGYEQLNKYDLGAVYYDWHPEAINWLKKLLKETNAVIVISSDWRNSNSLEALRLFFKIYDLDQYVVDVTPKLEYRRAEEIKAYLAEHPEIEKFVVIDDVPFTGFEDFGSRFVRCGAMMEEENYLQALKQLND